MLSLAIGFAAVIVLLLIWRLQIQAVFAGFFILFGLTYRIIDVVYLDVFGPVYAIELDRYVGGNGSAPVFIAACFAFIAPLCYFFSTRRLASGVAPGRRATLYHEFVANIFFYAISALIAVLFLDMLRIGVIPLFVGMDRLAYEQVAGVLHGPAYELNFLVSGACGVFAFTPRLYRPGFGNRFIMLLFALMAYWAFAGHRFSAFFVNLSFFFIPYAGIVVLERVGLLERSVSRSAWHALLSSKVLLPLFGSVIAVVLVGLLINSFYDVRGYADPLFAITQRVLVQPVEIWVSTWESIRFGLTDDINWQVIDQVITNPENPGGNTSISYLMERELGYFRANELLDAGQQFAGGFPEIFFLLFGIWWGTPLILIMGIASTFSLYLAVRSFISGLPVTSVLAMYVFYGFSLCYIGGFLTFIVAPTFPFKIFAMIVAWRAERYFIDRTAQRGNVIAHMQAPATPSLAVNREQQF